MLSYPEPDWARNVWTYGEEMAEDSDDDRGMECAYCSGPVDDFGWCPKCEEFSEVLAVPVMEKAA